MVVYRSHLNGNDIYIKRKVVGRNFEMRRSIKAVLDTKKQTNFYKEEIGQVRIRRGS